MQENASMYLIYFPLAFLIMAAVVAVILDVRWMKRYLTSFIALGWLVFVIKTAVESRGADDFQVFWRAGHAILQNDNPYQDIRLVNPPTALPLYALLGLLPNAFSLIIWKLLNAGIAAALIFCSYRTLQALEQPIPLLLPSSILQGCSVVIALSLPSHTGLRLGQVSFLVAFCLVLSLYAHRQDKQMLAGFVFAIATIKIHTALPFLMLWMGGKNWRAWLTLGIGVIVLSVAIPGPFHLLEWSRMNLSNIALLSQRGAINDYSAQAPIQTAASMLSFESLGYWLGLKDHNTLRFFQFSGVVLLGLWLLRAILQQQWSGGFTCAILTFYSMLFMYH